MDVTEKVELIKRSPTKEIVKDEAELIELLNTNSKPKHYIGLEISGFLHLGSLISTGFKINQSTRLVPNLKTAVARSQYLSQESRLTHADVSLYTESDLLHGTILKFHSRNGRRITHF